MVPEIASVGFVPAGAGPPRKPPMQQKAAAPPEHRKDEHKRMDVEAKLPVGRADLFHDALHIALVWRRKSRRPIAPRTVSAQSGPTKL